MQALCIRGRVHVAHTGLFEGRLYDIEPISPCSKCGNQGLVHASGSVFLSPKLLTCLKCGALRKFDHVPWGPDRFMPLDGTSVSKDEVTELFAPSQLETA